LKFESCCQPPPALLPQPAVVCGTVGPWGSQAFTTQVIPRAQAKTGQAAATDHCTTVKPRSNQLWLRQLQTSPVILHC